WGLQEKEAQERRISDPLAMDIFDLCLPKDQSIHALELNMLENMLHVLALQKGAPTWVARGLKIQESQLALA
ncbi:hypothetical protein V8E55_008508, partial [Tylopilus felleus]